MSDHQDATAGDERRSHARVNDDVYLEYLILTDEEYQRACDEFDVHARQHFNPVNQLQAISIRNRGVLDSIRSRDPEVADYLTSVSEQIQLLAHAIAQDQVGVPIVPNESVNLSAGGISFNTEKALEPDTAMEFTIIIVPFYVHIYTLGKVVYCRPEGATDPAYPYRVGVQFTHVHDADRDTLNKHIEEKIPDIEA
jgi:hypothetical protein